MRRFPVTILWAAAAVLSAALSAPAADVIASLQAKNATVTSFSCDFTQETRIPLFDSPVISNGRMAFVSPDGLRWEYTAPMREGFAVLGGKGFRWREGTVDQNTESAAKDPLLSIIAKELMIWVTLDMTRIEKEYSVAIAAADPPTLSLAPKRPDVAAIIQGLTIVFEPSGLARSVTISEMQGGVTVIRFSNAVVNRPVNVMERP